MKDKNIHNKNIVVRTVIESEPLIELNQQIFIILLLRLYGIVMVRVHIEVVVVVDGIFIVVVVATVDP
jgi:hypothetical protein